MAQPRNTRQKPDPNIRKPFVCPKLKLLKYLGCKQVRPSIDGIYFMKFKNNIFRSLRFTTKKEHVQRIPHVTKKRNNYTNRNKIMYFDHKHKGILQIIQCNILLLHIH